jgi:hypothetical protein
MTLEKVDVLMWLWLRIGSTHLTQNIFNYNKCNIRCSSHPYTKVTTHPDFCGTVLKKSHALKLGWNVLQSAKLFLHKIEMTVLFSCHTGNYLSSPHSACTRSLAVVTTVTTLHSLAVNELKLTLLWF